MSASAGRNETVPTYQYQCTACGEGLEVVQKFTEDSLTECPDCAGRLRKVFNSVGIVFKGSGFYRTDSRSSDNSATTAASSNGDSGGNGDGGGKSNGSAESSSSASSNGSGDSSGAAAKDTKPATSSSGSSSSGGDS